MARPQKYPAANTSAQWYQDNYPGASMDANVGVLHTTEGTSWPSYSGGAVAPNITGKPNFKHKRIDWRQHFNVDCSSRALQNHSGGVETNSLNAFQIELVGTCSPSTHRKWKAAGVEHIYWPEAPEWALRDLAELMAWLDREHGIPLKCDVKFVAYPESYGSGGQRLSGRAWRNYYGWLGHQHVPENVHGDPGNFPIDAVLDMAKAVNAPDPLPEVQGKDIPNVEPSTPSPAPVIEEDSTGMILIVHPNGSAYHLTPFGRVWLPANVRDAMTGPVTVIPCDDATWDRYKSIYKSVK